MGGLRHAVCIAITISTFVMFKKSLIFQWLYYCHFAINQVNLKKFGDFYGFELDFDDSAIHRKYNIFRGTDAQRMTQFKEYRNMNIWYLKMFGSEQTVQIGLFFEMMRYIFTVFPEV